MEITFKPSPKQFEAWEYLADDITTELGYGGAAYGGKSYLGSFWQLARRIAYPGTAGLMGRKELSNLKRTTLITFFEVCEAYGIKPSKHFNYNQQSNTINFANGSVIFLLDLSWQPSDPLYTRLGGLELTDAFIDESNEIPAQAIEIIKTRIGRKLNEKYNLIPKLLETFNPSKDHVYRRYYKPWRDGKLPEYRKFIKALPSDNPYATDDYLKQLLTADKVTKERLYYGNFEYDDDPAKLMEYDAITDLFTNNANGQGAFITADIARFGADATVIMAWHGWKIVDISAYERTSIPASVSLIEEVAQKYSVPRSKIVVDEDGLGGGVKDLLRCKGFISNSKPAKVKFDVENYDNLKSQCYYKLAEKVNDREISIDCQNTEMVDMIIEELEVVKQKDVDNDKKKGIIPKSKIKELIGRSPDYSDAIMMRLYFELFKSGRASSV